MTVAPGLRIEEGIDEPQVATGLEAPLATASERCNADLRLRRPHVGNAAATPPDDEVVCCGVRGRRPSHQLSRDPRSAPVEFILRGLDALGFGPRRPHRPPCTG